MAQSHQLFQKPCQPRRPLRPLQLLRRRYRVVAPIARSGFGAVYEAYDTLLDMPVALKIALRQDDELNEITMLYEEARQLAELHHPRIPGFIDFFEERGQWVLVQQLIAGGRICTSHPLSVRQVAFAGKALCEILLYLQREKNPPVIHRDIKPDNILVENIQVSSGQRLRFYLIDFGISGSPGENDFLGGSRGFASPEQLEAGLITPKTDIFSLGQTLRFLLTGQVPTEVAEASAQPVHLEPQPLSLLPSSPQSGYDRSLTLFAAMTEKCPEDRLETEAVWRELSAIYREVALTI